MAKIAMRERWDEASLRLFYQAFHAHGQDWVQIAAVAGNKAPEQCEALWKQHQTFLSIPSQPAFETAFIAMVADHYNNTKDEPHESAADAGANGSSGTAGNGVGAATGSGRDDAEAADEDGAAAADNGADDAWNTAQVLETAGRPIRSTRGKPPRAHSPGDEDFRPGRGAHTPRGARSALASPSSSKLKSGKGKDPESTSKKRSRRLFSGDNDLGLLEEQDEDELEPKSPYMSRWKGKAQQRDFEQGVDALLQLAMASSMDHMAGDGDHMDNMDQDDQQPEEDEEEEDGGREDADNEGNGSPPTSFLPAGTLDRPKGKRKVRPPARLDGGFASPIKAPQTTPRRNKSTPTLLQQAAAIRSPTRGTTPRAGSKRAASSRNRQRGRSWASDNNDEEMEEEVEEQPEEEESEDEAMDEVPQPRSARQRAQADRRAAAAVREAEQALQATQAHMDSLLGADGQPFTLDQATLAAMGMGSLQLPGLPNAMGMAGFSLDGTGATGASSIGAFLPPVSASMGQGARTGSGMNGHQRRSRRKPTVERPAPPDPSTTAQQQQQLMLRSMLGINRFDAAAAAAAAAEAPAGLDPSMGIPTPERSLGNFLSSPSARRWIIYEWHYSSLDRPFFMRSELSELLASLGLSNLRRLTRGEWGLVRGSFGKARRLSLNFLREERMKLEAYREHVRRKYDEVGIGAEVSPELPKPLRVGQEVTARHPVTRQLHDGVILTIKGAKYRVQFHRPELLTDVVQDSHVMPCDPRENLPAIMANMPLLLNGRSTALAGGGHGPLARAKAKAPHMRGPAAIQQQGSGLAGGLVPAGMVPVAAGAAREDPEADAALVAEVSQKLEAKEALLAQLKDLNSQSNSHQDLNGVHSETFQMHYTQTVLQLKEINASLEASYTRLQSRSNAAAMGVLTSGAGIGAPQAGGLQGTGNGINGMLAGLGGLGLAPDGLQGGLGNLGGLQGGGFGGMGGGLGQAMPHLALPPPQTPSDLAAHAVIHAAYSDAKAVVERYRDVRSRTAAAAALEAAASTGATDAQQPVAASPAGPGDAAAEGIIKLEPAAERQGMEGVQPVAPQQLPSAPQEAAHAASSSLDRVITSCLTVLCTVQRSVGEGMVLQAVESSMDLAAMVVAAAGSAGGNSIAALTAAADQDAATAQLQAAGNPNAGLYTQLVDSIRVLKNQLVKAV